jgi:hypothetical protein
MTLKPLAKQFQHAWYYDEAERYREKVKLYREAIRKADLRDYYRNKILQITI